MRLHLTDGEAAALLKELNGLIDGERCFLSDRIKALKAIRTEIRPSRRGSRIEALSPPRRVQRRVGAEDAEISRN